VQQQQWPDKMKSKRHEILHLSWVQSENRKIRKGKLAFSTAEKDVTDSQLTEWEKSELNMYSWSAWGKDRHRMGKSKLIDRE
jgi:hypothetical protein